MGEVVPFTGSRLVTEPSCSNTRNVLLSHLRESGTCSPKHRLQGERSTSHEERTKNILDRLDQIRHLVEQGRIEDFILISRDTATGHFLTEVDLSCPNGSEIFGYVGVLEALKLELTERAQLAPALMPDGSVLDPYKKEM